MSKFFSWLNKDKNKTSSAQATDQEEIQTPEQKTPVVDVQEVISDIPEQPSAPQIHQADNNTNDDVTVGPTDTVPVIAAQKISATVNPPTPSETSFFSRLRKGLSRTTENIGSGLVGLFRGKNIDDDLFEELETQLLIADVGMATTTKMVKKLTESANRKQLRDSESLFKLLKDQMVDILSAVDDPLIVKSETKPFVILMVGVNGVGKTTTIGKMAKQFQQQGKKVMLAAGDTFRAAAVEQLQVWGERNNIPVVAQQSGADSASVIFDAFQSAKAKNIDVLIADTAGRLQNKDHLMEELKKVVRVMKKIDPQAPHEIMLTLDAGTGQNAVSQTNLFHQAVGLTGLSLTKLDGTAKGGVIFAIADQFPIPIRYIGIGEGIDDLRPFNSQEFVEALFAESDKPVSKQQHH
ncbi:signal recognition particle-docking protein FtsY [Paraglaciecola hydrolytica]|uniref:Signal recognition particle receptor FtsY n=1 Tax=Paraglaciecola hydrolytica TaxID=1799789 RepID=A0A136A397_9ALTE|nr:signal recognition particle-docking protein FtsY [Paraglaciecola hydrolytica]KXI29715.1 signal recognition particle-docking protein FtsY [Paraglaciecola hydrolytica]